MEILRPARPEDWKILNDLCRQVHTLHVNWRPDIFQNVDVPYPTQYLLEDIKSDAIYCAEVDDRVVGMVRIYTWSANGAGSVPSKVMDIDDITIDEHYRHQGIGQRIMADLKEIAAQRGCNDLQLSVYPQNDGAVAFYQKCGFAIQSISMQRKV